MANRRHKKQIPCLWPVSVDNASIALNFCSRLGSQNRTGLILFPESVEKSLCHFLETTEWMYTKVKPYFQERVSWVPALDWLCATWVFHSGVSFRKGRWVQQELAVRSSLRTLLRWMESLLPQSGWQTPSGSAKSKCCRHWRGEEGSPNTCFKSQSILGRYRGAATGWVGCQVEVSVSLIVLFLFQILA